MHNKTPRLCALPIKLSISQINDRQQAALERYQRLYELKHGDDEVFQAGQNKIGHWMECENEQQQQQQQPPIESYYTVPVGYKRRRLEHELAHRIAKETDDFLVEDEIDQQ